MLTGTVDASEWLLMKQALEAVLSSCSLHDLHCELVVVGGDICCAIYRSKLVLSRSNLVMLCFSVDTKSPELKENALKEAEAYKAQKAKEVTERINTESEKITSAQNEKTTVLDKIFEEKHTQWEKEIFDNIISPK